MLWTGGRAAERDRNCFFGVVGVNRCRSMSTKRQVSGEDYPDAAIKHCDDARSLLSASRPDGAAYLAGYAVECTLKTLVQVEERSTRLVRDHNLTALSTEALRLAAEATNKTDRSLTN